MTIIRFSDRRPTPPADSVSDPVSDPVADARAEADRLAARREWDQWIQDWADAHGFATCPTAGRDNRLVVPCRFGELCIISPGRLCFRIHDNGQGGIVATIKQCPLVIWQQGLQTFIATWPDNSHPSLVALLEYLQPRRVIRTEGGSDR